MSKQTISLRQKQQKTINDQSTQALIKTIHNNSPYITVQFTKIKQSNIYPKMNHLPIKEHPQKRLKNSKAKQESISYSSEQTNSLPHKNDE